MVLLVLQLFHKRHFARDLQSLWLLHRHPAPLINPLLATLGAPRLPFLDEWIIFVFSLRSALLFTSNKPQHTFSDGMLREARERLR